MTTTNRMEERKQAILLSIKPKWAKLIYEGKKSLEVRTRPVPVLKTKSQRIFFCESGTQSITGMATCQSVFADTSNQLFFEKACLTEADINEFAGVRRNVFFHKLEDVQRFKKPVPLSEIGFTRSPQSWRYLSFEQVCIAEPIPF